MSKLHTAAAACLLGATLLGCPEPLPGEPARLAFRLDGAHAGADCISCHGPNDNWARCVDYEGATIACTTQCEDCHERPGGHVAQGGLKANASCNEAGCHANPDAWLPLDAAP